jgi:Iron-containing redox enzyme
MRRPRPRGSLSSALDAVLVEEPGSGGAELSCLAHAAVARADDVLHDDDVQVSLTMLYELHYTGLDGVDDRWEWDPTLIGVRGILEETFERRLRALVPADTPAGTPANTADAPADAGNAGTPIARRLREVVEADDGPPMSRFLERTATVDQWREFLVHRGTYQLKEADPHAFGIPRIGGRAKVALAEIEADEYGSGRPERMHAALFAQTMRELGLDGTIGSTVDLVPAITLAHSNAMSLFGLHRRLRGAILGHLAAFEMTSSVPNRRYANGLRRLGFGEAAWDYFDEHVEADAVHEQIAAHDMAGGLVEAEPQLVGDLLFGARVALALDALVSGHMLACWQEGRSSLLPPGTTEGTPPAGRAMPLVGPALGTR